ncbi:MAG: porin [Gammaproteobacteria bacterium]
MWEIIQAQQKEIAALKAQQQTTEQKVEATGQAVEQTVQAVEEAALQTASTPSWAERTKVGGYGELHYNNLETESGEDINEIDFHRFVLFFGHEFNDRIRFFSELEIEHSGVEPGEINGAVELEQAYIDFDINDSLTARGGLFLVPVGIINETHEPPTFYGVERNIVETRIIPSTWWEGGAALNGRFGSGFSYDLALTSGLATPTDGDDAYVIRDGRQFVSEAVANDPAYTGRIKYTGIPGLELAATLNYQADLTQGLGPTGTSSDGLLFETHAIWQRGPFGLRALYAQWSLDGEAPEALGREEQVGWYVEPSYKINSKFGLFARYSSVDRAAGSNAPADTELTEFDAGLNYYPHEDVVLKFDYVTQDGGEGDGFDPVDGFNLGIGYQF